MRALRYLASALSISTIGTVASAQTVEETDRKAGAWDRSVQFESQGQLNAARQVLLDGWGQNLDSYEVAIRLGWLCLKANDAKWALRYFEAAEKMQGADDEATTGRLAANNRLGYAALDEGDRIEARSRFQASLRIRAGDTDAENGISLLGPAMRISPEIWTSYTRQTGAGKISGYGIFAHAPLRINDWLQVRGAYRHLSFSTGGKFGTTYNQEEAYLGTSLSNGDKGIELMGFGTSAAQGSGNIGMIVSSRYGYNYGIYGQGALFTRDSQWRGQIAPSLFWWPSKYFGFSAGARSTMDPNGKPVSAIGGFSFRYKPISIDLAGHYGTERDPVTAATPIIFNPLQDLAYGAIGTVMIGIGSDWAIGVQSQWERMDSTTGNASYLNVGLGLQWSPSILR